MNKLLFILTVISTSVFAEFYRDPVGIVIDSDTHLEWQDDYSDNEKKIKYTTWKDAIAYCETLPLDGGGWRLPTQKELHTIVDDEKYNPAIDTNIFQYTTVYSYWSCMTDVNDLHNAKIVCFSFGGLGYQVKNGNDYVRCVKDDE